MLNRGGLTIQTAIDPKIQDLAQKKLSAVIGPRVEIGAAGETLILLRDLNSTPGSLYPLYFQYGAQTGLPLRVPVLDGGRLGFCVPE